MDFLESFVSSHSGQLKNINGSYITLVPKKQVSIKVNDFRPISLRNVCANFLTKLAANRLQGKILGCIHKNQYGFLRNRSIQDFLASSFEYMYLCQSSKRPIVILKLDFAKAFDTIEHEAILQVMEFKGFNRKWINCAKAIMSSGTSSILLNGIPGKQFECKRGVRQGDPISPLFYIFGSDLLQSAVNGMVHQGTLSRPIETNDEDFPIVQ
jgi:retron-type reverse transcriptase